MCGRFALSSPPQIVRDHFGYDETPNFPPRFNIVPTQPVAVVAAETTSDQARLRHFRLMRWGFLPSFVKDPKDYPLVFNIRSESLLEKPSYRTAIKRRRCLIPADAFYEWQRIGTRKGDSRPHLLRRRDGALLAFAGLYETWVGPNGEEVDTAAIITTAASDATAVLHLRLPAMLDAADFDIWLDGDEQRTERALELLRPPQDDALEFFAIGPAINKADNDTADVQQPASEAELTPAQGSLFQR